MEKLPYDLQQTSAGEPTEESVEKLKSLQNDCAHNRDPNSFYMTFDLRSPPRTTWSHNLKSHLGEDTMSHEELFKRIHPAWLPLHFGFAKAGYSIHADQKNSLENMQAIYSAHIPLRRKDGTYHWYNQVTFPVTQDETGELIRHLNHYYLICPYDNLVPSKPTIRVEGVVLKRFNAFFEATANTFLVENLRENLSKTHFLVLTTYRKLCVFEQGEWIAPVKSQVRDHLAMSASAINKANVRIMKSVKGYFPASVTHDIASLAVFLNQICGIVED